MLLIKGMANSAHRVRATMIPGSKGLETETQILQKTQFVELPKSFFILFFPFKSVSNQSNSGPNHQLKSHSFLEDTFDLANPRVSWWILLSPFRLI